MRRHAARLVVIALSLVASSCARTVVPGDVSAPERIWCSAQFGPGPDPVGDVIPPWFTRCPAGWSCYAGRGPNPGFTGPWCCPDANRGDSGNSSSIDSTGCCGPNGSACAP